MFIHLGGDMVIRADKIIAILDHQSTGLSKENQSFLTKQKKEKETVQISEDQPKSYIITKDTIYLSPISSQTLKRRGETTTILLEEEK
ncbi:extracellular matrix regulator RemB [Evansella clarkii]|jgi:hypothetical protein|uniref:extracellular matrix regulator RemB n=1 Tax=Evansella clarkii TaxID=79879 RepID=UPI0009981BAA|nr:DUF370 domain-containing protein [Evansella clarkii]